jgi:hypothetical protein
MGSRVMMLHEGKMQAGEHKIRLNTHGLSNGLYFCKVTAGSRMSVVKVTVGH